MPGPARLNTKACLSLIARHGHASLAELKFGKSGARLLNCKKIVKAPPVPGSSSEDESEEEEEASDAEGSDSPEESEAEEEMKISLTPVSSYRSGIGIGL